MVKETSVVVSELAVGRIFFKVIEVSVVVIVEPVLIPELTFKTGWGIVDNTVEQLELPEF
jgi:hypothetical protein